MEAEDMTEQKSCSFLSTNILGTGNEVGHFSKSVYNYQYGIATFGCRQISDGVHGDGFPGAAQYW